MPVVLECIGWTACPGGFDGVCVGCPLPAVCLRGGDFFFFGVAGQSFFRAIFKASNTQHKENNLNEHTSKGVG